MSIFKTPVGDYNEQGQAAVQRVDVAFAVTVVKASLLICEISSLHTKNPSKEAELMLSDATKLHRAPNKISKKAADKVWIFGFLDAKMRSTPAATKITKKIIP